MSAEGADLRHIEVWLFDLDNTLYPIESGMADQVERRITDFVQTLTGLPRDQSRALQKKYLAEHGLTLAGLIEHHGVDPAEYHAMFHDLPLELIARDEGLNRAIARLPGRRIIFTNADEVHARRVVEHLGVTSLFEAIFHIASADFVPKPAKETFERLLEEYAIDPRVACFFEDSEKNLAPAAALGMTTVLVGAHAAQSQATFVRYRTANLAAFLASARVKETA
jgi:putative hydrolase of the HAD superfamily